MTPFFSPMMPLSQAMIFRTNMNQKRENNPMLGMESASTREFPRGPLNQNQLRNNFLIFFPFSTDSGVRNWKLVLSQNHFQIGSRLGIRNRNVVQKVWHGKKR
jgi:hypothetical protein